jgi:hypothetical protein
VPAAKREAKSDSQVGEFVDLVKSYATQEIAGPLKGAGRAIALGVVGVVLLSLGIILLLVAVLRVLQTETSAFDGNWSFVPYAIDLAVAVIIIALALSRVRKIGFDIGEPRR